MSVLPHDTPLGTLGLEETFVYFDGPRLFSCRNNSGRLFIVNFVDEDDTRDKWLAAAISQSRLEQAKAGTIDLRSLFAGGEDGYVFEIDAPRLGGASEFSVLKSADVPNAYLPEPGITLLAGAQEALAAPTLFQRIRVRSLVSAARSVGLAGVSRAAEIWDQLLRSFDTTTDEELELLAIGARTGSVIFDLAANNNELARRATASVRCFIDAGEDASALRALLSQPGVNPFEYLRLLEAISENDLVLSVETTDSAALGFEIDASFAHKTTPTISALLAQNLDSKDVPQANTLSRVFGLLEVIKRGDVPTEENTKIDKRQINYYKAASRILGFLNDSNALTDVGSLVVGLPPEQRLAFTSVSFESTRCCIAWLRWNGCSTIVDVNPSTAEQFLVASVPSLSQKTARRRAQTLVSWRDALLQYHYSMRSEQGKS